MVGTTQTEDFHRLPKANVGLAGKVVEPVDLPAVGLCDPTRGPFEHQVVAAEFCHRLCHTAELKRVRQIAPMSRTMASMS